MSKKMDFEDYSWILRGRQRRKIISAMDNHPKIPTEIKENTSLSLNNVSDVLRAFTKRKIAKCLNPEAKTGRLYELTEKGKIIRDKLRESKKESSY